jgi:hypothetical protein
MIQRAVYLSVPAVAFPPMRFKASLDQHQATRKWPYKSGVPVLGQECNLKKVAGVGKKVTDDE